jgi:hypothetical protein
MGAIGHRHGALAHGGKANITLTLVIMVLMLASAKAETNFQDGGGYEKDGET